MTNEQLLHHAIGLYMVHWSSFELAIDVGTVKTTGMSCVELIKATGGCSVHDKICYLREALERHGHKNQSDIVALLARIPEESIRNSIAHSYMRFGSNSVIFIHMRPSKKVSIIRYATTDLFQLLQRMTHMAQRLSELFESDDADAEKFIDAVVAVGTKP